MFDWLKQRLVDIVQWFSDMFVAFFVALWDMQKDLACWLFETLFDLVISALESLDLSALDGFNGWGSLPSEMINILMLMGMHQAIGIVLAAGGIRLILQLIPFVRLGS